MQGVLEGGEGHGTSGDGGEIAHAARVKGGDEGRERLLPREEGDGHASGSSSAPLGAFNPARASSAGRGSVRRPSPTSATTAHPLSASAPSSSSRASTARAEPSARRASA